MLKTLKKMFKKKEPTRDEFRASIKLTGREINMTYRGWGHNMEKIGNRWAIWSTPRLSTGDIVITERGRFIAYNVEYAMGVDDMTFAEFIAEKD